VILPKRNEGDLDDVPEEVRNEIEFHIADRIDQVLEWALEPADEPKLAPVPAAKRRGSLPLRARFARSAAPVRA